ncbi:MAG TPA: hypothetical protein VJB34_02100 [Bdellovibrionota bacterium]|nr:hypothetical protein [Bdellovibrionota bacterium]
MRHILSSFLIVATSFILMTCGPGGGGSSGPTVASTTSSSPAGSNISGMPTQAQLLDFLKSHEWVAHATTQERIVLCDTYPSLFCGQVYNASRQSYDPLEQIIVIMKFNQDDGVIKYFGFGTSQIRGVELELATPTISVNFDIEAINIDAVTGVVTVGMAYTTAPFDTAGGYTMTITTMEGAPTPGFREQNSFNEDVWYSAVEQALFSAELATAPDGWKTDAQSSGIAYWSGQGINISNGIAEVVQFNLDSATHLLSSGTFSYYEKDAQGALLPDAFFAVDFDINLFETALLHDNSGNPIAIVHDLTISYNNSHSPTNQVGNQVFVTWNGVRVELLDLKVKESSMSANPEWELDTPNAEHYNYIRK